jgi:hypothetical protein
MADTHTYTFTKARLELIVDEHEALMLRAGAQEKTAERTAEAIRRRMCSAVALRAGYDGVDEFVVVREVRLSVDWQRHDEAISRGEDTVDLDSKVWEEGVSPETRVAVRRFREAVTTEGLDWCIVVSLRSQFGSGPGLDEASQLLNLRPPRPVRWAGAVESHESSLEEAPELTFRISLVSEED